MLAQKGNGVTEEGNGLVAVAIDKDKGSQYALKWAVDHLLNKGQTLILIHVNQKLSSVPSPMGSVAISDVNAKVASTYRQQLQNQTRELFLPFRCYCTQKDIRCKDVIIEDMDTAKALIEYVSHCAIETLVVGACSRNGFIRRMKNTDIPTTISKGAPDFCTVYIISKGKISSVRSASRPAPTVSPLWTQIQNQANLKPEPSETLLPQNNVSRAAEMTPMEPSQLQKDMEFIRSPFGRGGRNTNNLKSYGELSVPDTDISFVSSGRPSTDRMFPSLYDHMETGRTPWLSNSSDMDNRSFDSLRSATKSEFSSISQESASSWSSSQNIVRALKSKNKAYIQIQTPGCLHNTYTASQSMRSTRIPYAENPRSL